MGRDGKRKSFASRMKHILLGLPQDPRKRTRAYWVKRIVLGAVFIYITIAILMALFQRSFIYFPEKLPPDTPLQLPAETEEVSFEVQDIGRIFGIYHPPQDGELTVLLLHGNSKNVLHYLDLFVGLVRLNLGVLMPDYPGFGKSDGSPTEETVYRTAERALQFLKEQNIPPSKVVLFGKSLGTAVATHLATKSDCAGLILESPFKSIASVGQRQYPFLPVSLLVRDRYEILPRIKSVGEPLLVIVAEDDTLVVPEESFAVFEEAAEPKTLLTIKNADHNDIQSTGGEFYWEHLRLWLDTLPTK